jgi:hypothetical protein
VRNFKLLSRFEIIVRSHPWITWFAIVIFGNFVLGISTIDVEFLGASGLISIAIAYPIFLAAIKRTWPQRKLLAAGGMALHSIYLVATLGVTEATLLGLTEAVPLFFFIITISFGIPIYLALGQNPLKRLEKSIGKVIVIAMLVVFLFPVFLFFTMISAVELMQANAFREFCEHKVEGASIDEINRYVPAKYIRLRNKTGEFEISSHERGCVVLKRDGTLTVLQILPKRGFSWMLFVPPGTALQGTFEKGGIGQRLLFPDQP